MHSKVILIRNSELTMPPWSAFNSLTACLVTDIHVLPVPMGSLRDREVASWTSDLQVSNFESCIWRPVSSHSSHHPQDVILAQFSLYVHKGGLKPHSFHFIFYQF